MDGCTSGPAFDGEASPALKSVIIDALKKTPYNPNQNYNHYDRRDDDRRDEYESMNTEKTYYEYWRDTGGFQKVQVFETLHQHIPRNIFIS